MSSSASIKRQANARCGLIILGNSGVGKSFLANILLEREAFAHDFSAGSVTHETEFEELTVGTERYTIFNIPGLIESNQARINLNKREIEKAFIQRPKSVILYVFGQQNGRIRSEDVVAFNAINAAYPFKLESIMLVVNMLPKDRSEDYDQDVVEYLQELINLPCHNVCFLEYINKDNKHERQKLKNQLLPGILQRISSDHVKEDEISLQSDDVNRLTEQVKSMKLALEQDAERRRCKLQAQRVEREKLERKYQEEAECNRRLLQDQDQKNRELRKRLKGRQVSTFPCTLL